MILPRMDLVLIHSSRRMSVEDPLEIFLEPLPVISSNRPQAPWVVLHRQHWVKYSRTLNRPSSKETISSSTFNKWAISNNRTRVYNKQTNSWSSFIWDSCRTSSSKTLIQPSHPLHNHLSWILLLTLFLWASLKTWLLLVQLFRILIWGERFMPLLISLNLSLLL